MKAIDLIRWAMRMTDEGLADLVKDMRGTPLTRPVERDGVRSGNHPIWVLGHLAYIEGMVTSCVTGEANPVEDWAPLFGTGTQPLDDAGAYPPFDDLLAKLRELRAANMRLLESNGDEGLDAPPKRIPPGFEGVMETIGRTFTLLTLHQMVHYGQIADARRAAGLRPPI